MAVWAWCLWGAWIAAAIGIAAARGRKAVREGRARAAARRLRSPTVYLFAGYLVVAAFVTPLSAGESTSPLLWLALALPLAYGASSLASAAEEKPRTVVRVGLAVLFGGAVLAASAVILAAVSPGFVPRWMR